jgi:hypothetical protein
MKKLSGIFLCLSFALVAACGGDKSDPCKKLVNDICGADDKECAAYVEKDTLEGHMDAKTCGFLTGDKDYQKWLEAAKKDYADSKKEK